MIPKRKALPWPKIEIKLKWGADTYVPEEGRVVECYGGGGLCEFTIKFPAFTIAEDESIGFAGYSNGVLTLALDKSTISPEELASFSISTISVFDDIVLDDETTQALGLPQNFTIAAGDYPIVNQTNDYLFIEL